MKSIITLILFAVVEFFFRSFCYEDTLDNIYTLSLIGLIQYLFCLFSWVKYGRTIISPYIILLTTMYIFHCGQAFLFVLPIGYTPKLLGYLGIDNSDFFNALTYSLILLAFFHIGALIRVLYNPYVQNRRRPNFNPEATLKAIRQISLIFFVISIYPYYHTMIDNAIKSMTYGYGSLHSGDRAVGFGHLMESIGMYFIPSYICLLIGCINLKTYRFILYILGFFTCGIILLTGSRTYAVLILAILIVYQYYFIKKFSKKQIVIFLFCGILLSNVLTIVKYARGSTNKDLATYFNQENDENPVVEAISEMGGSMFCTIKMMESIPNEDDWFFGKTYGYAVLSLVPNLGFWDHHPSRDYGMTDIYLTNLLRLNYGTGSSMAAEVYLNFGYFGFIIFLIYGYIAAFFFSNLNIDIGNKNYLHAALIMMIFWFSLIFPRNPFMATFRNIIFYAIPIYLVLRYRCGRLRQFNV